MPCVRLVFACRIVCCSALCVSFVFFFFVLASFVIMSNCCSCRLCLPLIGLRICDIACSYVELMFVFLCYSCHIACLLRLSSRLSCCCFACRCRPRDVVMSSCGCFAYDIELMFVLLFVPLACCYSVGDVVFSFLLACPYVELLFVLLSFVLCLLVGIGRVVRSFFAMSS